MASHTVRNVILLFVAASLVQLCSAGPVSVTAVEVGAQVTVTNCSAATQIYYRVPRSYVYEYLTVVPQISSPNVYVEATACRIPGAWSHVDFPGTRIQTNNVTFTLCGDPQEQCDTYIAFECRQAVGTDFNFTLFASAVAPNPNAPTIPFNTVPTLVNTSLFNQQILGMFVAPTATPPLVSWAIYGADGFLAAVYPTFQIWDSSIPSGICSRRVQTGDLIPGKTYFISITGSFPAPSYNFTFSVWTQVQRWNFQNNVAANFTINAVSPTIIELDLVSFNDVPTAPLNLTFSGISRNTGAQVVGVRAGPQLWPEIGITNLGQFGVVNFKLPPCTVSASTRRTYISLLLTLGGTSLFPVNAYVTLTPHFTITSTTQASFNSRIISTPVSDLQVYEFANANLLGSRDLLRVTFDRDPINFFAVFLSQRPRTSVAALCPAVPGVILQPELGFAVQTTYPACLFSDATQGSPTESLYASAGLTNFTVEKIPPFAVVPGSSTIFTDVNQGYSPMIYGGDNLDSYPLVVTLRVVSTTASTFIYAPILIKTSQPGCAPTIPNFLQNTVQKAEFVLSCPDDAVWLNFFTNGDNITVQLDVSAAPVSKITVQNASLKQPQLTQLQMNQTAAISFVPSPAQAMELAVTQTSTRLDIAANVVSWEGSCSATAWNAFASPAPVKSRGAVTFFLRAPLANPNNVTILATAVGAADLCDPSVVPVADCGPYVASGVALSRPYSVSLVASARDTFATAFPSDFASNSACFREYMNATCRAVYPPCDPVTGVISSTLLCQRVCMNLLQQKCGVANAANAWRVCEYLPECAPAPRPVIDWSTPIRSAPSSSTSPTAISAPSSSSSSPPSSTSPSSSVSNSPTATSDSATVLVSYVWISLLFLFIFIL